MKSRKNRTLPARKSVFGARRHRRGEPLELFAPSSPLHAYRWVKSWFREQRSRAGHRRRMVENGFHFQNLEDRRVLSTFTVTNIADTGAGSLRQAIIDANTNVGPDTIEFNIEDVRPRNEDDHLGYWRVSSHLLGWRK